MTKLTCSSNTNEATAIVSELYQLAVKGDRSAENELLSIVEKPLHNTINRIIWEKDAREDIFQEALLACLIKLRKNAIKTPDATIGYMCTIGRNLAYKYIRQNKDCREHTQSREDKDQELCFADGNEQPDVCLQKLQTSGFIQKVLEQLSQRRDREILISYYFEEQRADHICLKNNLHKDHLYRVLHRARQRLGRLITNQLAMQDIYLKE